MSVQAWTSTCPSIVTTATRYWAPNGGLPYGDNLSSDETDTRGAITADGGTALSMWVRLSVAPGAGKSVAITLLVNGSPSALAVTISNTDTTGSLVTNVTLAGGSHVNLQCTPSGTPAATAAFVAIVYRPNTAGYFQYPFSFGYDQNFNATSSYYNAGLQGCNVISVGNRPISVLPFAGLVREVRIELEAAPGAGQSRAFDLYKNGGSIATYTISNTDTLSNNTGLSLAIAAGDRLQWYQTPSGGSATTSSCRMAVCIQSTTSANLFALMMASTVADTNIATTYYLPPGCQGLLGTTPLNTTESEVQIMLPAMTLRAFYAYSDAANTTPEVLTFRTSINGSPGNITATMPTDGDDNNCSDTSRRDNIKNGQLLSVKVTSATSTGDLDDWGASLAGWMGGAGGGGGGGGGDGNPGRPPGGGPKYGYGYWDEL